MRKLLISITSLGLFGFALVPVAGAVFIDSASQSELAEVSEAATDLANGNVAEAERKFRAVLIKNPASWAALLGLADIAYGRDEAARVDEYLRRARNAAPGNAAVQTAWGRYQYMQTKFSAAEEAFLAAAELDANLAAPHGELGALYLARLGQPDKAIEHYRRAIELAPEVPDYRYALSGALSSQDRLDEALDVIDETRELLPEAAYPLQLKASLLASHNRMDDALAALDEAVDLDPGNAQGHWARGELFMQAGEFDAARDAYDDMLAVDPEANRAHTRIGLSYQMQGDFRRAERAYKKALSIDPDDPLALNNLAYGALEETGRDREALRWAERAVALAPENPEFLDTLGMAQMANDDLDAASETLEKAVAIATGYVPAHYHLALVYEEQGDLFKAKQHYSVAATGSGAEAELSKTRLQALN